MSAGTYVYPAPEGPCAYAETEQSALQVLPRGEVGEVRRLDYDIDLFMEQAVRRKTVPGSI